MTIMNTIEMAVAIARGQRIEELASDIAEGALSAGLLDVWGDGSTYTLTREDCEWLEEEGAEPEDYEEIQDRVTHIVTMAHFETSEEWAREQEWEAEQYDKRVYCSDRTCGAYDCSRCYP
jgi:hypothetical protein